MSTGPGSTSGSKIMGAPAPVRHEDRGHAPHPHPYHHRIPPYSSPPTQSPRSRSYYHEGAPRDAASATTPKSAHISERYWDYSRQPPPPQSPRGHLPPPPGHHHVSHAPPPPSHHSYPHHAPMDVATHAQSQSSRHPAHYRPPPPMAPTTPSQHSPYPYPPRSSLSHYDEPYYSPRRIHDDPASLSAPAGHETYRGRPWIPPSASYPPPPHHYQQGHYSHNPPPPPPHPPQSHLRSHPGGTPSYPPVMPSPRDGKSHLPSPHTSQHHYPYHAPQGPPPSQRPSNAPPTPSYAQHPHAQIQPQHHKNVHHHSHAHPHSQSSKNPPPQFTQDSNEKPARPSPHSQSLQPHSHSPHPSTDPSRSSQSVPSTMPRPPHTSRAPSTAPRTTTVGPPPPKKEFSPSKGGAFQPYHRLRSRDPSMGLVHPHDHSHPPPTAPPANAGGPNHPSRASREAQPPSGGHSSIPNLKSKQNQNRECMVIDLNDDDDDGNGNGDDKKDRFEDAKERKLGVNSPISRGGIPADRMDNADLGKEESKATKQDMASKACSDPELQSDAAKEINDTKKPVDLDIATDRNAADSDGNAMEEKVSEAGFSNGVDASESLSKGKLEGSVIEAPNGKTTEQSPQDENPATEDTRDDENEQKSPPSITQHNYRREEPMPSSSTSTHPDKQSSKSPTSVDKRVHREDASTVGKRKQPAPISTMGPPIASKRPRQGNDSIGMDDATPKNYNGTRGPGIGSTARGPNPRIPHNASELINKRYRVADAEEYESSACASKFKTGYHPHHHYHPDYHRLPPPRRYGHDMDERQYEAQLRVPSLDSLEDRQDKSHGRFDDGRGDYDDRRYDHQSFSPSNQHPSDRSYDDYNHEHRFRRRTYSESSSIQMNRGPEDRRDSYEDLRQLNPAFSTSHDAVSLQQNNSLTEYPEPASIYATNKSMSWEVPPALSAICSFGELKNDLTSSPSLPRYSPTDGRLGGSGSDRRSARDANGVYVNEDDVEDDELPPIPGARADVAFPPVRKPFLEQRPTNQPFNGPPLRDSYDGRHHHHPDWPYDHPRDRYPPSHYPPRDRSLPHHPSRYPDVRYNDMRGHYPPPPHENERRYRDELRSTYDHRRDYDRRYDRTRDVRDLDRQPSSRHRDPYSSPSFQQHERYEQDGHHRHLKPWHSPPSASRRDHYLSYPHDTPGGTDSYSYSAESREHMNYPSRSMDDLEEATSFSLALRPSFSWEAPLPKSPRRDEVVEGNADDGDSRIIQLKDQRKLMNSLAIRNEIRTLGNLNNPSGLILLLAMPQDRHCLSETLCTIRSNVEVFTATEEDVNAPAPGRKRPVRVGQVGLRCVYCRSHRTDRVKRATCFPSAISRIYRAVIDMKLDHFSNCRYVPPGLKTRLDELQAGSSRSTGMTVQYFVKSAKELGMRDAGDDGVFIDLKRVGQPLDYRRDEVTHPERHQAPQIASAHREIIPRVPSSKVLSSSQERPHQVDRPFDDDEDPGPDVKKYHGKVLLALPDDESFLSPLRCFLRENVCVFSATERDIAVRTPTTFSVRVGQVGVGCVHCLGLPPKSRSNRAVCFPFTVARIYQSVADIQRFHLGECRMMPPEVRAKFLQLQSESAKGSKGLATRTYWIDSAKKLGLADGPTGMYFSRDPSMPPPPSDGKSLDILAQVATNVKTKCKPLVTPEDKPTIAEFLYVVMDQLQPCRFTDADRNKRRSKNLGSIGVECKHCAGKIDGRKFFWSSVSAAESNFVSVHSHMMDCKYIPDDFKAELARLKSLRREQTSKLKTGSQKSFFTRVWNRLHNIEDEPEAVAKQKKKGENSGKSVKKSKSPKNSSKPPPSVAHGQPKTQGTKIATSSDRDKSNTNSTINQAADLDSVELKTGSSSDSIHHDDIRALLESKSTLTSAASGDDLTTKALEAPESLDIEINEGARNHIEAGRGSDSISRAAMDIASKSSLGSVAVNMSAVSFRSHDDRRDVKNEEDEQIEKSSVAV